MQATAAQTQKANVYLDYTRIFAPTNGIVDTRVALSGEVVNPGQAIVTLNGRDILLGKHGSAASKAVRDVVGDAEHRARIDIKNLPAEWLWFGNIRDIPAASSPRLP